MWTLAALFPADAPDMDGTGLSTHFARLAIDMLVSDKQTSPTMVLPRSWWAIYIS